MPIRQIPSDDEGKPLFDFESAFRGSYSSGTWSASTKEPGQKFVPIDPDFDDFVKFAQGIKKEDVDMKKPVGSVNRDKLPVPPVELKDNHGDVAIEYILFAFDCIVVFGIINQTEKFKTKPGDNHKRWGGAGMIEIVSSSYIEINPIRIYLRGTEPNGYFDIATYRFNSAREADAWVEKAHASFKAWAESLK